MADNTTLNAGTGGDVISTDDIAGVKVQRVKVQYGADGSATDVDSTHGLPVLQQASATSTTSQVSSSASTVQLLASNTSRIGASFFNDSTSLCYLKCGTTASATDHTVQIAAGGFYELNPSRHTGRIDAIWSSANGSMRITEFT